jgi:hypothetical protein
MKNCHLRLKTLRLSSSNRAPKMRFTVMAPLSGTQAREPQRA